MWQVHCHRQPCCSLTAHFWFLGFLVPQLPSSHLVPPMGSGHHLQPQCLSRAPEPPSPVAGPGTCQLGSPLPVMPSLPGEQFQLPVPLVTAKGPLWTPDMSATFFHVFPTALLELPLMLPPRCH